MLAEQDNDECVGFGFEFALENLGYFYPIPNTVQQNSMICVMLLVDKVGEPVAADADAEFGYLLSCSTWRRGAIDIAAPEVVDPHWPGILGHGAREDSQFGLLSSPFPTRLL